MTDHDTYQPLDGPASLTFRGFRFDPQPPPDPDTDPACVAAAARVRAAFAADCTDSASPDAPAPQECVTRGSDDPEAHPSAVTLSGAAGARRCEVCSRELTGRAHRRHCSGACRMRAHRARQPVPALYPAERGR